MKPTTTRDSNLSRRSLSLLFFLFFSHPNAHSRELRDQSDRSPDRESLGTRRGLRTSLARTNYRGGERGGRGRRKFCAGKEGEKIWQKKRGWVLTFQKFLTITTRVLFRLSFVSTRGSRSVSSPTLFVSPDNRRPVCRFESLLFRRLCLSCLLLRLESP